MEKIAIVTSDTAKLMRNALKSPEDLRERKQLSVKSNLLDNNVYNRRRFMLMDVCVFCRIHAEIVSPHVHRLQPHIRNVARYRISCILREINCFSREGKEGDKALTINTKERK
jgi:hypothetical protein